MLSALRRLQFGDRALDFAGGGAVGALTGPTSARLSTTPDEYYGEMSEDERQALMLRAMLLGALGQGSARAAGMRGLAPFLAGGLGGRLAYNSLDYVPVDGASPFADGLPLPEELY